MFFFPRTCPMKKKEVGGETFRVTGQVFKYQGLELVYKLWRRSW